MTMITTKLLNKLRKNLMFIQTHYEDGTEKEKLILSYQMEDIEDIILQSLKKHIIIFLKLEKELTSAIVEFHLRNKETIWNDKFNKCQNNSLIIKSSQISDQDLTTKGKALSKSWTMQCPGLSKQLWLPTVTDFVDSDLTLSKDLLGEVGVNSWCLVKSITPPKMNLSKTLLPSCITSQQKCMVRDDTKKKVGKKKQTIYICQESNCDKQSVGKLKVCQEHFDLLNTSDRCYCITSKKVRCNKKAKQYGLCGTHLPKQDKPANERIKSRMIKLYPTKEQRDILKQWFGVARKVYNKTLCLYRYRRSHKLNFFYIRDITLRLLKKHKYVVDTPRNIKAEAINDYVKAHENVVRLYQTTGKTSNFTFRSKKDISQSIVPFTNSVKIIKNQNNRNRLIQFYSTIMSPIKTKEDLPDSIKSCRIVMKNNKTFYVKADIKYYVPEQNINPDNAIGLDPNEKNIFGFYSQKECGIIGENIREVNDKINNKLSKLQSKMDKSTSKTTGYKKLMRNVILKLNDRKEHMRDDLHWKLCNKLCEVYDVIHLPKFEEHKKCVTLNSITNRRMFSIGHSLLRKRLQYKAEIQGKMVNVLTEEYTTLACTNCLVLNKPKDRLYQCKSCGLSIHRDIGSPRNIFMKGQLGL